jgi:hypothetical protein
MSNLSIKRVQVGNSTAGNNFVIRQPDTADGTLRISNGNIGTTTDLITVTAAGNLTVSGTITAAAFSGNATSATTASAATTVTLVASNTTNAIHFPVFVDTATGNRNIRTDDGYTYNPSSGQLTAVILTASSDARLKENIKPITGALELVNKLEGVLFNRIGQPREEIGVVAQQVETVVPQLVFTDEQGMKSVAYANAVALLIEAIKEQQLQIEELKGKLV